MKFSKQKQKLYCKFLKSRTKESEVIYKAYMNLFEAIRKKSKITHYSKLFAKYRNDIKSTWKIINDIISNTKNKQKDLPEKLVINNTTVIAKQEIAENLNKYFTNNGPNLASKILNKQGDFEKCLPKCKNDTPLTDEEVRNAFYFLKTNKSPSHNDISFNAINNVFDFIVGLLRYIFSNSLVQGMFPEEIKIAQITPICEGREKDIIVNYRPISVLSCFSKILEKIIYNKLYLYLTYNCFYNLLYNKQFGFQKGHSTDNAIVQLADQIHEMFNKNIYTLGVCIDLSKAFDTVKYEILLKRLSHYGIKNKSLDWFTCYLSNRK